MTRYYITFDHITEWVDWSKEYKRIMRSTDKNRFIVVDAETEAEAVNYVITDVYYTDKREIVSVTTTCPASMPYLAEKEVGFFPNAGEKRPRGQSV